MCWEGIYILLRLYNGWGIIVDSSQTLWYVFCFLFKYKGFTYIFQWNCVMCSIVKEGVVLWCEIERFIPVLCVALLGKVLYYCFCDIIPLLLLSLWHFCLLYHLLNLYIYNLFSFMENIVLYKSIFHVSLSSSLPCFLFLTVAGKDHGRI